MTALNVQLLCSSLSEGQKCPPLLLFPHHQKLAGDTDGAVGADDNAEEQHQNEIMYGSSAKEEQSQDDEECG